MTAMNTEKAEFTQLVKAALAHLYDYAYLQTHPLVSLLIDDGVVGQQTRGQELRKLLLGGIEALNPGSNIPFRSPERRGYASLFCRYVEGQSPSEIAQWLAISERQLRREHGQALEAVISILWNQYTESQEKRVERIDQNDLRREASRVISWEEIELWDIVEGVLSGVAGLVEQGGVNLGVQIPDDLPPLYTSRTLVRQILFNVLGRTVQCMSGGEVTLEVWLEEGMIIFSVVAIREDSVMSALRFSSLEEGLTAAFQFVESLGGRMWLEGKPEQGLAIRFALPAVGEETVLAIDDNEALFRLWERYLTRHPYQLVGVRSGDEGIQLARELKPAVIILDVMMPDRDGWEILQTLSTDPLTRGIPVIVCSVLYEPELAFSLGARAYLKKPVEQVDLLSALDQVLKRGAEVREQKSILVSL